MKTNNYVVATFINLDEKTISVTARDPEMSKCQVINYVDGSFALHYNNSYWPIHASNLSVNQAKQIKAILIDFYVNVLGYKLVSAKIA
jgi:hypothetical protein